MTGGSYRVVYDGHARKLTGAVGVERNLRRDRCLATVPGIVPGVLEPLGDEAVVVSAAYVLLRLRAGLGAVLLRPVRALPLMSMLARAVEFCDRPPEHVS